MSSLNKERKQTLYSRNGIKIVKYDMLDTTRLSNKKNNYKIWENTRRSIVGQERQETNNNTKTESGFEYTTCESKLGFYYQKSKYVGTSHNRQVKTYFAEFKQIIFQLEREKWILEYPISYKEMHINKEMRPWDLLPGYKGIPDHFINDLYKETNKFFDLLEDYNSKFNSKHFLTDSLITINTLRKKTLIDLFGDERGPQVQMNSIKILSHGFDLKESFRKRKES